MKAKLNAANPEAARGEVADIQVVPRSELFPNEFESARSSQRYYKLIIKCLEALDRPILSPRPRRLVFIPTTWGKISRAEQINDLFDDSPKVRRFYFTRNMDYNDGVHGIRQATCHHIELSLQRRFKMTGEAAFDLIAMGRSSIDLYSNDIGSPFVEIKSFSAYVGGSSTNIAVGAKRLGLRTALLTGVGPDLVGDFILSFLEKEGVETRYIPRKPGTRSSAVLLGVEPPDRFPLVFYRDNAADAQLTIDDVRELPLQACRVFEFAGTNLSKEPSRSATIYAVEQARKAGVTVVMDVDFRADQWHDPRAFGLAVRAILPYVDIVLGTQEEIKAAMLVEAGQLHISYSQISAPEVSGDLNAAIEAILTIKPRMVAVKQGAKGCTLYQPGVAALDVPGFPVEIFNVLGAGDAFASGFIYGYLQGWDWFRVARLANACGAIVVTRHACANDMPRLEEVLQFMADREAQVEGHL